MKFFKESFRRLSRLGSILFIVSVVLTIILGVQNIRALEGATLGNVFSIMPVLPYYVFAAGFGFALLGFSFLDKRSDSDFYHCIPISRSDLYLSVTAASLTWMVGTIVVNALLAALIMGIFNMPFVPAYLPLGIFLFIAAAMLIFAATAIGCSLTGTLLSNVVMTGLVLFLPRFILFFVARGIVDGTQIVGWLDLPRFLRPDMNAASGLIAMLSRQMFISRIANMGTILYSLALAIVELAIGWMLFRKRPSELAEQGAHNRKLQTVFACLLSLPVLLLVLTRVIKFNTFTALMVVAALAVYVVYQIIGMRNMKRVMVSLPFFLCPLAVTVVLGVVIQNAANSALRTVPSAGEMDYVVFEGYDSENAVPGYTTLQLSKIHFTEDEVKSLVADSLAKAVENVVASQEGGVSYYQPYSEYETIERICIVLKNGQKIRRGISFENVNALNDVRSLNSEFGGAIRALPTETAVKSLYAYGISQADTEKLRDSLTAEMQEKGLIASYYYRPRVAYESGRVYNVNGEQVLGDFSATGYVGQQRFSDVYNIRMETPKTASLYMMLCNRAVGDRTPSLLKNTYEQVLKAGTGSDYVGIELTFDNVPAENGDLQQMNMSYYANVYDIQNGNTSYAKDYAEQVMAILQRGTLTNDATTFHVALNWYWQFNGAYSDSMARNAYYAFSPEDEAALIQLAKDWAQADMNGGRVMAKDAEAAFDDAISSAMPTPTLAVG